MKEVTHLLDERAWTPIKYDSIVKGKNNSKSYISQVKEGWLVADGIMQERDNGQDVSSPTLSTESLFLLATVLVAERRRVITVDIEGSFLHGVDERYLYGNIRSVL